METLLAAAILARGSILLMYCPQLQLRFHENHETSEDRTPQKPHRRERHPTGRDDLNNPQNNRELTPRLVAQVQADKYPANGTILGSTLSTIDRH